MKLTPGISRFPLHVVVGFAASAAAYVACSDAAEPARVDLLVAELLSAGIELRDRQDAYTPFADMHGYSDSWSFVWGGETIRVTEFEGPTEALVAASRLGPDGISYRYGSDTVGRIDISGNDPRDTPWAFLRDSMIVQYIGDDERLVEGLRAAFGAPFAGAEARSERESLGTDYPLFRDLWRDVNLEISGARIESGVGGVPLSFSTYFIVFETTVFDSSACTDFQSNLAGEIEISENVVRLGVSQRLLNEVDHPMAIPCEYEMRPGTQRVMLNELPLNVGEEYAVVVNGEEVASFTVAGIAFIFAS